MSEKEKTEKKAASKSKETDSKKSKKSDSKKKSLFARIAQWFKDLKKEFKKEVRKYLKDINGNSHISRSKKIQATLFSYSLFIYKIALKVISKE